MLRMKGMLQTDSSAHFSSSLRQGGKNRKWTQENSTVHNLAINNTISLGQFKLAMRANN